MIPGGRFGGCWLSTAVYFGTYRGPFFRQFEYGADPRKQRAKLSALYLHSYQVPQASAETPTSSASASQCLGCGR
jgi:hypothetical protein